MSKFFSLLKASFTQGMNILNYKVKDSSSVALKLLLPVILAALIMFSVGAMFFGIAEPLHEIHETSVILTFAITFVSILALLESIYKSQDLLFNCRDNDLLFSLPIPRSKVFSLRVIKLLAFQFLYNCIFLLPAFAVYIYFETPGLWFYPLSLLMLILTPLLPTAIGVVIGFFIRGISVHSKFQKLVQTLLTIIVFFAAMAIGFAAEYLIPTVVENATSISEVISKFYYPAGAFSSIIREFDFANFFGLLAISILPLALVIWLCSLRYFQIISKTKNSSLRKSNLDYEKIKSHSALFSLTKKELSRYFSSTVYMFNTLVGLAMLALLTGAICIGGYDGISTILSGTEGAELDIVADFAKLLPILFMFSIIFTACSTSITSSIISLEGKSFNITKSLPVPVKTILKAKVLMSLVITTPFIVACVIIFALRFQISLIYVTYLLCFAVIAPIFSALLGLIINLKYPKMDATNDTEVVKQSSSSMISVFAGIGTLVVSTLIYGALIANGLEAIAPGVIIFLFIDADFLLWKYLKTWGVEKFNKISA